MEFEALSEEFPNAVRESRPVRKGSVTPEDTVRELKKAVNFPRLSCLRRPWLFPMSGIESSTAELGGGWQCHIFFPYPLTSRTPAALFVTKDGVLLNPPSGKPAFRTFMRSPSRNGSPVPREYT